MKDVVKRGTTSIEEFIETLPKRFRKAAVEAYEETVQENVRLIKRIEELEKKLDTMVKEKVSMYLMSYRILFKTAQDFKNENTRLSGGLKNLYELFCSVGRGGGKSTAHKIYTQALNKEDGGV